MAKVRRDGEPGLGRPEVQEDMHRPPGVPMPRERTSQKAQVRSGHVPGDRKDVKRAISHKTGLK